MKTKGFTLIEILIAVAVFAILATITSSALYYAFNTRARVSEQADRLNSLELTITRLERDTQQAVAREVRGDEMHLFTVFIGNPEYLEFTRGGLVIAPGLEKRSTLQRIAFLCKDKQLIRRSWPSLDTPTRKIYEDRVLLAGLDGCQFAYLNNSLQLLSEWRANAVQQNQRAEPFPKAIQLTISLKKWGKMTYLFIIPGALYGEK